MSSGEANESAPWGYIAAINAATDTQRSHPASSEPEPEPPITHHPSGDGWPPKVDGQVLGSCGCGLASNFYFLFLGAKKWPKKEVCRQKWKASKSAKLFRRGRVMCQPRERDGSGWGFMLGPKEWVARGTPVQLHLFDRCSSVQCSVSSVQCPESPASSARRPQRITAADQRPSSQKVVAGHQAVKKVKKKARDREESKIKGTEKNGEKK